MQLVADYKDACADPDTRGRQFRDKYSMTRVGVANAEARAGAPGVPPLVAEDAQGKYLLYDGRGTVGDLVLFWKPGMKIDGVERASSALDIIYGVPATDQTLRAVGAPSPATLVVARGGYELKDAGVLETQAL